MLFPISSGVTFSGNQNENQFTEFVLNILDRGINIVAQVTKMVHSEVRLEKTNPLTTSGQF